MDKMQKVVIESVFVNPKKGTRGESLCELSAHITLIVEGKRCSYYTSVARALRLVFPAQTELANRIDNVMHARARALEDFELKNREKWMKEAKKRVEELEVAPEDKAIETQVQYALIRKAARGEKASEVTVSPADFRAQVEAELAAEYLQVLDLFPDHVEGEKRIYGDAHNYIGGFLFAMVGYTVDEQVRKREPVSGLAGAAALFSRTEAPTTVSRIIRPDERHADIVLRFIGPRHNYYKLAQELEEEELSLADAVKAVRKDILG